MNVERQRLFCVVFYSTDHNTDIDQPILDAPVVVQGWQQPLSLFFLSPLWPPPYWHKPKGKLGL